MKDHELLFWTIYAKSLLLEVEFSFLYSAIKTIAQARLDNAFETRIDITILMNYAKGLAIAAKNTSSETHFEISKEDYKMLAEGDEFGIHSFVSGNEPIQKLHVNAVSLATINISKIVEAKGDIVALINNNCEREMEMMIQFLREI
jgi:hypothetical protein